MTRFLLEAGAFLLWITGVPFLIREVFTRGRTGILLYHDPSPDVFERHLAYLARHYSLIPFSELVAALDRRDWSAIPPKSLVIHIDDGYAGNYRLLDALSRYQVRPTLYVCSHIVGTNRRFWSRLNGGKAMQLRLMDNERLLRKLREEAAFTPDKEYADRQALSTEELQAMLVHVDCQSHGRYHFSLLTIRDDQLLEELVESRAAVERLTSQPCLHFSFPYGDYSSREINAVRQSGYRTARTTEAGWNGERSDRYRLKIVADVPGRASVNMLRAHLSGLPRATKRLAYRYVTRHLHAHRQRKIVNRRFF